MHSSLSSWHDAYCREFLLKPIEVNIQASTLYFLMQVPLTFLKNPLQNLTFVDCNPLN